MSLKSRLNRLIDDLTMLEASVCDESEVLAYTRIEYEGDTINWLAPNEGGGSVACDLQDAQLVTGGECRASMLQLSTSILKSLLS